MGQRHCDRCGRGYRQGESGSALGFCPRCYRLKRRREEEGRELEPFKREHAPPGEGGRLVVRVALYDLELVRDLAEVEGLSLADWVRQALECGVVSALDREHGPRQLQLLGE